MASRVSHRWNLGFGFLNIPSDNRASRRRRREPGCFQRAIVRTGGLCGEDYQYWNSDGNYYVDETRWHSDGSSWSEHEQRNIDRDEPFFFFKLALYLDPLDGESGAVRVIPGE